MENHERFLECKIDCFKTTVCFVLLLAVFEKMQIIFWNTQCFWWLSVSNKSKISGLQLNILMFFSVDSGFDFNWKMCPKLWIISIYLELFSVLLIQNAHKSLSRTHSLMNCKFLANFIRIADILGLNCCINICHKSQNVPGNTRSCDSYSCLMLPSVSASSPICCLFAFMLGKGSTTIGIAFADKLGLSLLLVAVSWVASGVVLLPSWGGCILVCMTEGDGQVNEGGWLAFSLMTTEH